MTAVRRVRRFDPGAGPFCAWLCGIAANVLRNQLRAAQATIRLAAAARNETLAAFDGSIGERERAERVADALRHCPNDPSACCE